MKTQLVSYLLCRPSWPWITETHLSAGIQSIYQYTCLTELLQCQAHSGYKSDDFYKKAVSQQGYLSIRKLLTGKAAHQTVKETLPSQPLSCPKLGD